MRTLLICLLLAMAAFLPSAQADPEPEPEPEQDPSGNDPQPEPSEGEPEPESSPQASRGCILGDICIGSPGCETGVDQSPPPGYQGGLTIGHESIGTWVTICFGEGG